MSEEYVRKDVYDANSARLEALMEKTEAKNNEAIAILRAELGAMKGEIASWNERLNGAVNALSIAIQDTNKRIDDGFNRLTITFTVVQIGVAVIMWLLSR